MKDRTEAALTVLDNKDSECGLKVQRLLHAASPLMYWC